MVSNFPLDSKIHFTVFTEETPMLLQILENFEILILLLKSLSLAQKWEFSRLLNPKYEL